MPRHKTTQKAQAKYLYFTTSHTQKAIAQMLGVDEGTITRWVRQGNWAEIKKSTYHSPEQEVEQLYNELRRISEQINAREDGPKFATKEELEARTKILNLITGPLKNTADTWRNIVPELDIEHTVQPQRTYKEMSEKEKIDHFYAQIAILRATAEARGGTIHDTYVDLEPLPG